MAGLARIKNFEEMKAHRANKVLFRFADWEQRVAGDINVYEAVTFLSESATLKEDLKQGRSIGKIYDHDIVKNPVGDQVNLKRFAALCGNIIVKEIMGSQPKKVIEDLPVYSYINPMAVRAGLVMPGAQDDNVGQKAALYWAYNIGSDFMAAAHPDFAMAIALFRAKYAQELGLRNPDKTVQSPPQVLLGISKQTINGMTVPAYVQSDHVVHQRFLDIRELLSNIVPVEDSKLLKSMAFIKKAEELVSTPPTNQASSLTKSHLSKQPQSAPSNHSATLFSK